MLKEPKIEQAWAIAYDIHVWGFHEAKYNIEDIEEDVEYAEWIVKYTREALRRKQEKQNDETE